MRYILLLVVLSYSITVAAQPSTKDPAQFIERLASNDLTRSIEVEVAAALRTRQPKAIHQLALRLAHEDGWHVLDFWAYLQQLPEEERAEVAFKFGPCHYAGLTIRGVVALASANKIKAVQKGAAYVLVDSDLDDMYFDERRRCELIKRLPTTERLIGTSCLVDGKNCKKNNR